MSMPARHPRTLTRQLTIAGIVFGLVEVLVFALLIGAVRSADDANQRTNEVLAAVQTVSDLEKSVIDAETGMRGFVITGREQFLEPTNAARGAIPDEERLARGQAGDSDERALLEPLVADIDSYLTQWLDRVVTARRQSAGRAANLVATGEGKRRVDDIRAQVRAIRAGLAPTPPAAATPPGRACAGRWSAPSPGSSSRPCSSRSTASTSGARS